MAHYGSIRILDTSHLAPPDAEGTVRVVPNPAYENGVLAVIHTIAGAKSGNAVVHAIAHRGEWDSMIIVPYQGAKPNASASMLDPHTGRPKGIVDTWTDPKTHVVHRIKGTGGGSSTVVQFSPHTWDTANHCHLPGALADEILIHEMFHGLRQLQGLMHHKKVGGGYDNQEEFYAILIANIYTSEKHPHRHLRANHHGFHVLAQGDHQSAGPTGAFLASKENRERVESLIRQQPTLCDRIALVPCHFNPIRRLLIEADALV